MKKSLYFVLALLTLVYIGFLCYANLIGLENMPAWMTYISIYGGLGIALLYAAINFFGNPLKIVFFILLIVMVVLLVLIIAFPDKFRELFKIGQDVNNIIKIIK